MKIINMRKIYFLILASCLFYSQAALGSQGSKKFDQFIHKFNTESKTQKISYESISDIGKNGFLVKSLIIKNRDKNDIFDTKIKQLAVYDIDWENFEKKNFPHFAKIVVTSLVTSTNIYPEFKNIFQNNTIEADLELSYNYTNKKQQFLIEQFNVSLPNLATLDLSADIQNFKLKKKESEHLNLMMAVVKKVNITFNDISLIQKVVQHTAVKENKKEAKIIKEASQNLRTFFTDSSKKHLDPMLSFLEHWKKSGKKIEISATPKTPVGLVHLMAAKNLDDMLKLFNVKVSYIEP